MTTYFYISFYHKNARSYNGYSVRLSKRFNTIEEARKEFERKRANANTIEATINQADHYSPEELNADDYGYIHGCGSTHYSRHDHFERWDEFFKSRR